MALVAGAGVAICYSVIGPPTDAVSAIGWLAIPAVVVPVWAFLELISERSVTVQSTGVTVAYPRRTCFIPWDRLQLSPLQQYPGWARAVTFLEVSRQAALLRQVAHVVTPEQARAILEVMPNPPQNPFVRRLFATSD